ncbi:MAG TPA: type II CAAX endopeptidase family protein [Planctomycetota bacterium]
MPNQNASSVGAAPLIRSRWQATVTVLILLQLPWPRWLVAGEDLSAQTMRELLFWLMATLLLIYVLWIERRPLRSVGLRKPDWRTLAWGAGGAAAMVAGMAFIYMVVLPALGLAEEEQLGEVRSLPLWFRVGLVTRAAVFEELYYRGFAIERIAELTGMRWLAALISLLLFTVAHLGYWGWAHLMVAGFGGLVLTVLYLLRRDLGAAMLAHWLTDGVGFLLG